MALINQNSIIGVTSITSPSASNVLTFHTNDTTERLRVTASGVSFSGTNASLDTSGNLTVGGNVNVAGVLTYEDVTSVDAVGLSTFQNGIHVTGGSVGIGTDNPNGVKLHLQDSGSPGIRIVRDNAADYAFNLTTNGAFYIYDDTADAHRFQLHSDGKIAFGNYTPTYDLDLLRTASGVGATMRVGATAVSGINTASVIINNGGTGNASLDFKYENAATPRASIYVYRSDQELRFDTAGTERLRITSAGQLRSQATYNGSATTSNTFPCLNLNNLQGSYTANNFIGGVTFGKAPGHGNGIRAGMLALYASTGSIADNIGTQLSFRTSTESGGDGKERLRITSTGAIGIGSDFTAIETAGGGGITLDSGVGGGNIGVFLKATGYTGNQTKLWQDSANAVSYLESTERPLIIKAGDSSGSDYLRIDVAGSERFRISSTGNVLIDSASNGTRYTQYQILTGSKTFGTTSGAWTDVARVGHSHAIEITYMVVQGGGYSFGGAHGTSLMNTRYGASSGEQVLHRNTGAMNGGEITGHELRYLNSGGTTDYLLQARVTFTGTTNGTFTMGYSIKGHSSDLMYSV